MIILRWRSRRAQLWLDELPEWCYEAAEVAERHQEALNVRVTEIRSAAVELFVPVGPRAYYGALGAKFVPGQEERLIIQVPISAHEGQPVRESLARRVDKVSVGLSHEFVGSVLDGVLSINPTQLLGAGTLCFCCAAYGEFGSSAWIFRVLGRIVVKLLSLDRLSLSEKDLIRLLDLELRWPALSGSETNSAIRE